eukprot:g3795.t1
MRMMLGGMLGPLSALFSIAGTLNLPLMWIELHESMKKMRHRNDGNLKTTRRYLGACLFVNFFGLLMLGAVLQVDWMYVTIFSIVYAFLMAVPFFVGSRRLALVMNGAVNGRRNSGGSSRSQRKSGSTRAERMQAVAKSIVSVGSYVSIFLFLNALTSSVYLYTAKAAEANAPNQHPMPALSLVSYQMVRGTQIACNFVIVWFCYSSQKRKEAEEERKRRGSYRTSTTSVTSSSVSSSPSSKSIEMASPVDNNGTRNL